MSGRRDAFLGALVGSLVGDALPLLWRGVRAAGFYGGLAVLVAVVLIPGWLRLLLLALVLVVLVLRARERQR